MGDQTDLQADIPFARFRATDVPFETEPFPPKPNTVKRRSAPSEATNGRKPTSDNPKSDLSSTGSNSGVIRSITAGGVAASHAIIPSRPVLVAPASAGKEFNRIKRS